MNGDLDVIHLGENILFELLPGVGDLLRIERGINVTDDIDFPVGAAIDGGGKSEPAVGLLKTRFPKEIRIAAIFERREFDTIAAIGAESNDRIGASDEAGV